MKTYFSENNRTVGTLIPTKEEAPRAGGDAPAAEQGGQGAQGGQAGPTKVTITGDSTEINGTKIFGISLAVLPPPDGKTPDGKSAWQEFAEEITTGLLEDGVTTAGA